MAKIIDAAAISGMVMERGEEDPHEALRQFHEAAERLNGTGVDLVVTCETMMMNQPAGTGEEPECPGKILDAYRTFARENRCVVAGAARTMTPEGPRQSIVYYGPNGENWEFTICFSSYYHGGTVMANWAFRTRAFQVGAQKDIGSEIYDPLGRRINATAYYNRIARGRINLDHIVCRRSGNSEKYPEIMRKYGKKVLIDLDSPSACGIIYSCNDEFTARDIAEEFGLVPREELLRQSRELRKQVMGIR